MQDDEDNYHEFPAGVSHRALDVFFTHLKSKTNSIDGPQCVFSIRIAYISELNTVQPGLVRLVRFFNLKSFKKRNKTRVDAPLQ